MKFPREIVHLGECVFQRPIWKGGGLRPNFKTPAPNGEYQGTVFENEKWAAHRLSYHLNIAPIPRKPIGRKEGLVLHTCDRKWCINPDHLYLGTAKQNAIDNAERNIEWRRKRSEIQKRIGFPKVSPEGKARAAAANRIHTTEYFRRNPDIAHERCAKMRLARWGK